MQNKKNKCDTAFLQPNKRTKTDERFSAPSDQFSPVPAIRGLPEQKTILKN